MVDSSNIKHLSKEEIIKNGSIFTPQYLVVLVSELLDEYISLSSVIGDFGSGYGAFLQQFSNKGKRCFATELDEKSYRLLKQEYPKIQIYHENSLSNISRNKYNLSADDELIVIGNPPYNDVTSLYKKGEKGSLICDESVYSRDFGVSFLKTYSKLEAKYICVLHPLAYLIKKNNFKSLGFFKENYKLIKSVIFSSKHFESIKKTNSEFPVVASLYQRNLQGMNFDFINNFQFNVYNSNKKIVFSNITTIDNEVDKYPKKGKHNGLQFYTLRDINALMRNTTFIEGDVSNGIEVKIESLYKYGWVLFFKNNFKPQTNKYIYGNLSPLYPKKITKEFKNASAYYAFNNNLLVRKYFFKKDIENEYGKELENKKILYSYLKKMYIF